METRKMFLCNPCISLSISLLRLPCVFLFSLKFRWLLNETMDVSSWNVGHVLKTACKWSSWSLIWEQDGTNVSFISHIPVCFLSCVISVVLQTLPSPSSAVLLKVRSLLCHRADVRTSPLGRQLCRVETNAEIQSLHKLVEARYFSSLSFEWSHLHV